MVRRAAQVDDSSSSSQVAMARPFCSLHLWAKWAPACFASQLIECMHALSDSRLASLLEVAADGADGARAPNERQEQHRAERRDAELHHGKKICSF